MNAGNFFQRRVQRSSLSLRKSSTRKPIADTPRPVATLPRKHYLFIKNGTVPLAIEDLTVNRKSVFDESKISLPSPSPSVPFEKQTKKGVKPVTWEADQIDKHKSLIPSRMISKIVLGESNQALSDSPSSSNLITVLKSKAVAFGQSGIDPDLMDKIKKSIDNFPGLERQRRLDELSNCPFDSVETLLKNGLASVENFNSLIRIVGHKQSANDAFDVLEKMIALGFEPNQDTFVSLVIACGSQADLARSAFLRMRSLLIPPNEKVYGALIKAHVREGDISSGFALLRKMEDEHVSPSVIVYTTLIDGLVAAKKIDLAWEVFRDARTWKNIKPDAVLFSVMIKACIVNKECEKAINTLDDLRMSGEYPTDITYSHLIECMSVRADFADKAFEFYRQMIAEGFQLNGIIAKALVHACAVSGDLERLRKTVKDISDHGFLLDKQMYADMIMCVGNSLVPSSPHHETFARIRLAWYIVADMREKGIAIDTPILNALTKVYIGADQPDHAIQMLEQFSTFNTVPSNETYELLLEYFGFKNDPTKFFVLFDQWSDTNELSDKMFNLALDVAIESQSSSRTVKVLEKMVERQIFPLPTQAEKLAVVGRKIVQIHQVVGKLVAIQRDRTHDKMVRDNALVQLQIEEHTTRLAAIEGKTVKDPSLEQQVRDIYFSKSTAHKPPRLTKSEHLQVKKKGGELHSRRTDKPKHNILAE